MQRGYLVGKNPAKSQDRQTADERPERVQRRRAPSAHGTADSATMMPDPRVVAGTLASTISASPNERSADGLAAGEIMQAATRSDSHSRVGPSDDVTPAPTTNMPAAVDAKGSAPTTLEPEASAALGSGVRQIKRTRTLADVVQPTRSAVLAADSAAAVEEARAPVGLSDTMPTLPGVQGPRVRRATADTRPIAGVETAPITRPTRDAAARVTRRLGDQPVPPARADVPTETPSTPETPTEPALPEWLGAPGLVTHAALAHAAAALVAALAASALLVAGDVVGLWLLGFVVLALPGAALAFTLVSRSRRAVRWSALILVGTQLGALAWAYVLLGPRVELALVVVAGTWLAYRLGGPPIALLHASVATGLTLGCVWASYLGLYRPVVTVGGLGESALVSLSAMLGIGLTLCAVLAGARAREKSDLSARARLYELRRLRVELSRNRRLVEDEAEVLGNALVAALHGKGIDPITIDGPLGPVAEIGNAVAERLSTLQKDREERIRQEGALRMVIAAVERGWLGLPWVWPEPSGTAVDELVALLRAPRPREQRPPLGWLDDIPTLPPHLGLSSSSGYWRRPYPTSNPSAASYPDTSHVDASQGRIGWDDLLGGTSKP